MITTAKGRTFEIFLGGTIAAPLYYAHTHCVCGSTFSSGEWFPKIESAMAVSADGVEDHERKGKHVKVKP